MWQRVIVGVWSLLEKFFDRVNHDVLMAYVTRQIEDKRVYDDHRRVSPVLG
jgi:retron-type reverse transcriptase